MALGGVIGVAGIGLLFWPEITGAGFNAAALQGLGLCVLGTLFFCSGNMISTVGAAPGRAAALRHCLGA